MKKDWLKLANEKLNDIPPGTKRFSAQMAARYQASYSLWSIKALLALARYVIPFAKKYWDCDWNVEQAIGQVRFGIYPYEARTPRLVRFLESWKDYSDYCYYRETCRQLELSKETPKESPFFGIESLWPKYDEQYFVGIDWVKSSDIRLYKGEGEVTKALYETEEMFGLRPSGLSLLKEAFGYVGYAGARLKFDEDADKA